MYEECNGAEKYYFYDSNGIISGIRYFDANGNMTMIYVVTNAQGDVIALYDKNGNAVVEYQYDAWGNIVSVVNSTEGSALDWNEINPFRYRGYYYDAETELYYLQSRYYDAEVGRFLNADCYFSTGTGFLGYNMFAYCNNNPVNFMDFDGKNTAALKIWSESMWWLCGADTVLPVGDIVYVGGILLFATVAFTTDSDSTIDTLASVGGSPNSFNNNDDDDDYYDDESNFAGKEKIGKSKGKTPRDNRRQNKQAKAATKGMTKEQKNIIHKEISGKGFGFKEIVEIAQDMFTFMIGFFI